MQQRKRLTFQLTPLLDLLLIVIFAQYMEVQQTVESGDSVIQDQQTVLQQEFDQRRKDLESAHAANQQALEATRLRYSQQFKSIIDQHHQAGTTLAETLNLPGRLMEETLKLRSAGKTADADRLEQAVNSLQKLLESRSSELLQFMVRYDEMQKHVSVWEVHLLDNGQALITDGKLEQRLSYESPEEFGGKAFESSKSFEEPRPLTLILMTYGDTQAGFRRNATDGLPVLVQRLRDDAGGTRWYDFSLMGFRPDGPLMNSTAVSE
jgi:hypothetical protein